VAGPEHDGDDGSDEVTRRQPGKRPARRPATSITAFELFRLQDAIVRSE